MSTRYVAGVSGMDLFATRCGCGELTVHGFWGQLRKFVVRDRVHVSLPCGTCGRVGTRSYRLVKYPKAARRHRLVDWTRLFWFMSPYLPLGLWQRLGRLSLKLERWFPI